MSGETLNLGGTKTATKTVAVNTSSKDVFVLVLLPDTFSVANLGVGIETPLCGLTIEQWLDDAVSQYAHRKVDVKKTDDIISLVKKYSTEHKYTMVLYADTPLITNTTIDAAVLFTKAGGHTAVRMPRGWVFDTNYIKTAADIKPVEAIGLNAQDFLVAYNVAQTKVIESVMRARIVAGHIAKGVSMPDCVSIYIDATVKISPNAFVERNVHLAGHTVIGQSTKVLSNSRLQSAQIGMNCIINAAHITNSKIGSNCVVQLSMVDGANVGSAVRIGPYANIRPGSQIGNNCRIGSFVEIKSSVIGGSAKILHLSSIVDENVEASSVVDKSADISVSEKMVIMPDASKVPVSEEPIQEIKEEPKPEPKKTNNSLFVFKMPQLETEEERIAKISSKKVAPPDNDGVRAKEEARGDEHVYVANKEDDAPEPVQHVQEPVVEIAEEIVAAPAVEADADNSPAFEIPALEELTVQVTDQMPLEVQQENIPLPHEELSSVAEEDIEADAIEATEVVEEIQPAAETQVIEPEPVYGEPEIAEEPSAEEPEPVIQEQEPVSEEVI